MPKAVGVPEVAGVSCSYCNGVRSAPCTCAADGSVLCRDVVCLHFKARPGVKTHRKGRPRKGQGYVRPISMHFSDGSVRVCESIEKKTGKVKNDSISNCRSKLLVQLKKDEGVLLKDAEGTIIPLYANPD